MPGIQSYLLAVAVIVTLGGCAQPATHREEAKSFTTSVASPQEPLVCRLYQEDKIFDDALTFRIPVHDDRHGPALQCSAMIDAEQTALKSARTIPILDLGLFFLAEAAQWMLSHPDVRQCVQRVDAPNLVLARFLGLAVDTHGPTKVLVRNCDGNLFFVTNADIPVGTPRCASAHRGMRYRGAITRFAFTPAPDVQICGGMNRSSGTRPHGQENDGLTHR